MLGSVVLDHASQNFVLVAVIVQARRDKHLNPWIQNLQPLNPQTLEPLTLNLWTLKH